MNLLYNNNTYDPIVVDDEEINAMKKYTEEVVKSISEEFSIHDFRMTDGGERINLIFDLVIPTDDKSNPEELVHTIQQKLKEKTKILCSNKSRASIFKSCFFPPFPKQEKGESKC